MDAPPRSSSPHSGATRRTFRARPPARATGRRILLIASGGAADLRQVDPALLHPADRLVLNDVNPNALQYALTHLPPATRADRHGPLATSCAPPPIWPPTTAPSIWSWPEDSSTTSKNASREP
ncbi:hypothetical protein OG758_46935 [Streptomyces sp. NBC_01474]|uniref:hypothetical protein n=1 Tax=Streptomyces sp. NBC_01474 TaxID=2903880 RepID=UPI002DD9FD7E|nr:hypothetical protein [Streptomyces sp. NBC_01474]WSE01016.1 hypothetical protein OG758_46935 [Streptomyces sp. NBC_01474]